MRFFMFIKPLFGAALLVALPINGFAQTEPEALAPTSQWKVDYAERECRLTRTFGEKKNAILFRLARGSSFDKYDIMLAGLAIPKQGSRIDIHVALEPVGTLVTFKGNNLAVPKRKERLLRWFDGPTDAIIAGPKNQTMLVKTGKIYAVRLKLDDFKDALAAMTTCHNDLLRSWEIDPETLAKFQKLPEPTGNPGAWATTNDYPSNLLSAGISGTVAFKIKVGADGKPVDCMVIESSRVEALDNVSCQLVVQRARFRPAIGGDGRPAAAPYINRIRWQIPE